MVESVDDPRLSEPMTPSSPVSDPVTAGHPRRSEGLTLTAIAAVGSNLVIGDGRGLLWRIPEDFARFKAVTMGGALVMGRKTYESMGAALRGRMSIVLTRDRSWRPEATGRETVEVVSTMAGAAKVLTQATSRRWWCCGGGEIYRLAWPYTTDLDITAVHQAPDGPVTFPMIDPKQWRLVATTSRVGFDFTIYTRRDSSARSRLEELIADAS
ncbi:MAG: dihydrofolate reductase [Propionibacteriaceae bacterium]|jgi:dihydrofolate reductase|nr:dihydrofolate reductase [Propionibacteriaceae bacterium]